jgi:hypothetical protein
MDPDIRLRFRAATSTAGILSESYIGVHQTSRHNVRSDKTRSVHAHFLADIHPYRLIGIIVEVFVRAATSTAGILYLSSIPVEQHMPFYTDLVNVLPREPKHWDSFMLRAGDAAIELP